MEIELMPRLIQGKLVEVTEVGVKIEFNGRLGMLSVPLRMVFTDKPLVIGDEVELYVSYVKVITSPNDYGQNIYEEE
jgi:hypothetical protein